MPLNNFLHCIHLTSIFPVSLNNFLHSYSRCPWITSCIHLVLYLVPLWPPKVPTTRAFHQLPAFMRIQYLNFPSLSPHSFLHAPSFGFNIENFSSRFNNFLHSSLFRYLISPSPICLFLTNFQRLPDFNIYIFPHFSQHLLACILSQYLNFPPSCSSIHFRVPKIQFAILIFFCIYLHIFSFYFNI